MKRKTNTLPLFRSDFIWSYCIHSSRSFPYKLIDPTSTESSEALFPLADALNHKPKTKITWCREGDIKDGSLSLVSGEKIQAGDQVYNNYGPKVRLIACMKLSLN